MKRNNIKVHLKSHLFFHFCSCEFLFYLLLIVLYYQKEEEKKGIFQDQKCLFPSKPLSVFD